jgi:hypothetical protein
MRVANLNKKKCWRILLGHVTTAHPAWPLFDLRLSELNTFILFVAGFREVGFPFFFLVAPFATFIILRLAAA